MFSSAEKNSISGASCREEMFSISEMEVAVTTISVTAQSSLNAPVESTSKMHNMKDEPDGMLQQLGRICHLQRNKIT